MAKKEVIKAYNPDNLNETKEIYQWCVPGLSELKGAAAKTLLLSGKCCPRGGLEGDEPKGFVFCEKLRPTPRVLLAESVKPETNIIQF